MFACRLAKSQAESFQNLEMLPHNYQYPSHCHAENTQDWVRWGRCPNHTFPIHLGRLSNCPSSLPVYLAPPSHTKSHTTTDLLSPTPPPHKLCSEPPLLWAFWVRQCPPLCFRAIWRLANSPTECLSAYIQFLWIPNFNLELSKW